MHPALNPHRKLFAYSRRVSLRTLKEALAGVSSMPDARMYDRLASSVDVAENSKQGGA